MVLVNMQKEAQRREESLQRSLLHVKERLQSQVSQERFEIIIWSFSSIREERGSYGQLKIEQNCVPFKDLEFTTQSGLG